MSINELNEMILGERHFRSRAGSDAHFSLTATPQEGSEGRFQLDFECRFKGIVHLLLMDENGVICLQTDHRCKAGHNQILLNLVRFPAGRYQVDLLFADHIDQCTLIR